MGKTVHRLEQALCVWEDFSYLSRLRHEISRISGSTPAFPLAGPIANYHRFRQFLLSLGDASSLANLEKFYEIFIGPRDFERAYGCLQLLPAFILAWTMNSRRVFSLSGDLQRLLAATSLEDVTFGEIPYPFNSFAVSLETPIIGADGAEFDFLVFRTGSIPGDKREIGLFLLDRRYGNYNRISGFDKKAIEKSMAKGSLQAYESAYQRYASVAGSCKNRMRLDFDAEASLVEYVPTTGWANGIRVTEKTQELAPEIITAQRLTAGLCMYLATLPSTVNQHRSGWMPLSKSSRLDPRAITNAAQICTVTSQHVLTAEERQTYDIASRGMTGYELSAHFRRGHWRRPPGKGDDPLALKIVWVRPTLVRRDRLGPGELPGGSQTNLL
ncbi:MAG: hypothetical protein WC551_00590 [Patescibacteria group bacterium]